MRPPSPRQLAALLALTHLPIVGADETPMEASLTLWDVGFSLRDAWAAFRDDPCPTSPASEDPVEERAAIFVDEDEQDIESFEDWRRRRDGIPDTISEEDQIIDVRTEIPPPNSDTLNLSINKYNYASPDCSARVISSSSTSQHASSVLHKSRDRYMLTPCKAKEHWVVIELCDEIRIQAMELAVWEFFSGIVRDVTISVSTDEDDTAWTPVESFVGKNIRGAQTFILAQPTSFHRFVRVEFSSYYGSEYYCPVSQLKVFGMNQMEAFKFEQKRTAPRDEVRDVKVSAEGYPVGMAENETADLRVQTEAWESAEMKEIEKLVQAQASLQPGNTTSLPDIILDTPNSTTTDIPRSKSDSSESIYAFIVRRLDALESNSSLVARYVDEQSRLVKSLLRETASREETARQAAERSLALQWEQERMRQEERLGRISSQIEAQRTMIEVNRRESQSQLRLLADELSHERRRGLAQLIILLIVVGLGVATRSSAIDAILAPILAGGHRRTSSRHNNLPDNPRNRQLSKTSSLRRPPTPTAIRKKGGFRSVSSVDMVPQASRGPPKRMARSAHLHVLGHRPTAEHRSSLDIPHATEWEDQHTEASVSDVEREIM